MIGICVKAGITCPSCESNIPLNAMVPRIRCAACGTVHELDLDVWKTVLDEAIDDAPFTDEGSGSSSTIFGTYNMRLEYGRLMPRPPESETPITEEDILSGLETGSTVDDDPEKRLIVRKVPEEFADHFKGIVALIGEEESLIPGRDEGTDMEVSSSGKPVAIQCPGCGGSLIVSGKVRSETCRYCDSSVRLPDELWSVLHPAVKMIRWYLLYDRYSRPFSWEDYIFSALPAGSSDFILVVENEEGDYPVVTRVGPDRTPVWIRDDLEIECSTEEQPPGMIEAPDSTFLVMSTNERDLLRISAEDGSVVDTVRAVEAEYPVQGIQGFSMEDCRGITCFPDGSILLLRRGSEFCRFLRFDMLGRSMPLWGDPPDEEEEQRGILARAWDWLRSRTPEPTVTYMEGLTHRPEKVKDSDLELLAGSDGSLYMLSYSRLAAFDEEGAHRYTIELPCSTVYGRPCADGQGRAYILAGMGDSSLGILRVSRDGKTVSMVECGEDGDLLVLQPDGTLHVLAYGGVWVTVDTDASWKQVGPSV